jgi:transcriptional regulator with XRE-family HTH domain
MERKKLNNLDYSINTQLRDRRKELNMTMLEVARCLGKPHSYVGLIESGQKSLTTGELQVYCSVLSIPLEIVINISKKDVMWKFKPPHA